MRFRFAIENNLDIELGRYPLPTADTELLRTKGGGLVRGLNFTLAETPAGTGGPLSAVPTNSAVAGRATAGSSVATNALALNVLGEPQTNYSIQGTIPQSNGTLIPSYDPFITGQLNWTHQTTPQTSIVQTGSNTLVTGTTLFNAGVQQGFASGATAALNFTNSRQSVNSFRSGYNPYTGSGLGLTVTQPLLRGYGATLNRRFIRIAVNEQKMTNMLFRQQLILTVYGVIRLYTDLVALNEDEKVKQETVTLAEKLLADVRAQVEEGTLARVEMTRANAQVFSTRQDLINATGLREEQEAILKNVLTRRGNGDPGSCLPQPTSSPPTPPHYSAHRRSPPDAGDLGERRDFAASRISARAAADRQFEDRSRWFAQRHQAAAGSGRHHAE